MLFYKGGPMAGQPRGYAFVTFATTEGAITALHKLNGLTVLNRPIAIRLAKNVNYDELDKPKTRIEIPALGTAKREGKISRQEAIQAIENKLKLLERNNEDLGGEQTGNIGGPDVPLIHKYQFNKNRENSTTFNTQRRFHHFKSNSSPYHKHQRPKRR